MVVNFAVEDDPNGVVLVGHGLVAAGDVNDREPSVCKPHGTVEPQARPVGTAVLLYIGHAHEPRALHPFPQVEFQNPGNRAHR